MNVTVSNRIERPSNRHFLARRKMGGEDTYAYKCGNVRVLIDGKCIRSASFPDKARLKLIMSEWQGTGAEIRVIFNETN